MADAAPAVLAPVLLTRLLVPLLTASAPSRIVNVGSLGLISSDPWESPLWRWWPWWRAGPGHANPLVTRPAAVGRLLTDRGQ